MDEKIKAMWMLLEKQGVSFRVACNVIAQRLNVNRDYVWEVLG